MSSTLPLCFKLNPPPQPFPFFKPSFSSSSSLVQHNLIRDTHICFTFQPSSSNSSNPLNYGPQEEARWLREEQRWLREEQRWLREEARWNAERLALLNEIQRLNLRLQELEQLNSVQGTSVSETLANIAKLLQVLKEGDLGKRIPESGSSALPVVVETAEKVEELVVKEVVKVPEKEEKGKKRATLRMGSEGDDVRAMQEALQKLGFYSGEEDMEFSSFLTGTERAVKTWQATLGAREDGIMTAELLERLYMEQKFGSSSFIGGKSPEEPGITIPEEKGTNGAAIASVTEISEVEEAVVSKDGVAGVNISEHRVFLLGENRWEEPSRLSGRNKQPESKSGSGKTTTKCLSCRGEGRLLCMECDGSGEPNVEPQFLEWVEEGTKCPYCEGQGHIICDVCDGKKVIEA